MAVRYTLPVLLSLVKTAFGVTSTLSNLRPGVGANTNTVAAGGWLSGTPTLLAYRGAANLNVSAANCATIDTMDTAYNSGSASSSITFQIRANGQLHISTTGDSQSANHAMIGDNPNRWLYRTGIDSDVDVTEHIDVRFTKRSGVSISWGMANNTWLSCSTTRQITTLAARSGGSGGDSDSIRGWLAFRKAGDTSNTLIGNTFVELTSGAYSDSANEP